VTPPAVAQLWLGIAIIGGAIGTFLLLHYAVDVKDAYGRDETKEGRELAWSRLRLVAALVAGYVADILLGLAALGVTFNLTVWYALFFAKAGFWFYVMYKSVRLRLMFEDVQIGSNGGGDDHVTGV
jgi:hypothetical protein